MAYENTEETKQKPADENNNNSDKKKDERDWSNISNIKGLKKA